MTGYSEFVKRLWNEWQLSGLVLSSLLLQLSLTLTAHRRKIKAYRVWSIFYWLIYLGSPYAVNCCLGIISQVSSEERVADPNMQLQAFWASILLFHLGGLDNFTALTLEDNQLWLRHAADLFLQAATTVYIFIRYLPEGGYRGLLLPFIFIFLAASLKCFERVGALRKGSMEGLRESMLGEPDPGPDYADTMDRYVGKSRSGVPPLLNINEESRQAAFMPGNPEPGPDYDPMDRYGRWRSGLLPLPNTNVQAKSMLEDPNLPEQDREPTESASQKRSGLLPPPNTNVQAKSMLEDPNPSEQDREPTESASQKDSESGLSYHEHSFPSTYYMNDGFISPRSSPEPHGFTGPPSLPTSSELGGVTQHHHASPDPPALPSSSRRRSSLAAHFDSSSPCSTEIQGEPQPQEFPPATFPEIIEPAPEQMSDVILAAYDLFSKFKGVLVDGIFSFKEREESQAKFLAHSWKWAFDVIETELSFAYDVLYTKASVSIKETETIPTKKTKEEKETETISPSSIKEKRTISRTRGRGGAIRVLSLVLTVSTLLFFIFQADRIHEFLLQHRCVTYALLAGAVFVDIVTLLQFFLSDWSIVDGSRHTKQEFVSNARWSNLMSQYNLIGFCLKDRPSMSKKILGKLGLKESWDRHRYTRFVRVDDQLKQFLFTELWDKAQAAKKSKNYKPFNDCRGDWVLQQEKRFDELGWSVRAADFDESLLIWHIATDLCHRSVKPSTRSSTVTKFAVMAKELSDYMLYLLVMRPLMLPPSTIMGTKRFRDTCAEVKRYFERHASCPDERTAYAMLLQVERPLHPLTVKGDQSKSVLWDGCLLAKQLGLVDPPETRWKIVCKVWVEMLCYAGMQCEGYYHAEQLRAGGELLTFACFLMTHLGMGKHYKIEFGNASPNFWVEQSYYYVTA